MNSSNQLYAINNSQNSSSNCIERIRRFIKITLLLNHVQACQQPLNCVCPVPCQQTKELLVHCDSCSLETYHCKKCSDVMNMLDIQSRYNAMRFRHEEQGLSSEDTM